MSVTFTTTPSKAANSTDLRPAIKRRSYVTLLCFAVIVAAVAALFYTAPKHGEFWFSDAPRHAMDGAFYRDLIVQAPMFHPKQWAMQYYIQYPAIVVLVYPPLFAVVEAIVFLILGVSHFSAQLTVALFFLGAGWGAFRLANLWLDRAGSLAAVLFLMAAHEVALWGRQVMLEIPVYCFVLWSSYCLFRYIEQKRPRWIYGSILLLLAALYTKQTVAFMLPVLAIGLYGGEGKAMFRDRSVRRGLLLLIVGLIPLAAVMLRFSGVAMNDVLAGSEASSRLSAQYWFYYLKILPRQTGWVTLGAACAYVILSAVSRNWRLPGAARNFLLAWFCLGYLFFSTIRLHESRHTSVILFPLAVFAVLVFSKVLPAKVAPLAAVAVALAAFSYTVAADSVPRVSGYQQAADYIGAHAPANSVILFSGYRDGSFIFSLRARHARQNFTVLRSDKLLTTYSVYREWGLQQVNITPAQIADMLDRYGVSYVVEQPNFWSDLKDMQMLHAVLNSYQFRKVAELPVTANVPHEDRELVIYQNLGPVASAKARLSVSVPLLGLTVDGKVGKR